MNPSEFEFDSVNRRKEYDSLAYLVGVTSCLVEQLKDPRMMWTLMSTEYEAEDAAVDPSDLNIMKQHWPSDYRPIAPVSLGLRWSPIAWLLGIHSTPVFLTKDERKGTAIGVWYLEDIQSLQLPDARNDSCRHFCDILVRSRDLDRGEDMLFHIVAKPGWSYEYAKENALCEFDEDEVRQTGMLLWRRCL
jgi:hypothetical protein